MYIKYFKKQFCTFAAIQNRFMILFHIQKPNVKISNRRAIKKWIAQVLTEKRKSVGDINIIICDSEYILQLNKQYLNHNYYTDVLTFPYTQPTEKWVCGDLFIDIETVERNATLYRQTKSQELLRVIIHGILHLLGMDDKTKEERLLMRNEEDKALQKINVKVI